MVFTFLLHVVGANWSAGACTSTFPEYEVISHPVLWDCNCC